MSDMGSHLAKALELRQLLVSRKAVTHHCLTPPLEGIPSEFLDETYPAKTRGMGLLYDENCLILTSTVFD